MENNQQPKKVTVDSFEAVIKKDRKTSSDNAKECFELAKAYHSEQLNEAGKELPTVKQIDLHLQANKSCTEFESALWMRGQALFIISFLERENAEKDREIVKYGMHLPECYKMQDWSEALDAFANTPTKFRDAGYTQAVEEMNTKMQTCSCGFEKYLK